MKVKKSYQLLALVSLLCPFGLLAESAKGEVRERPEAVKIIAPFAPVGHGLTEAEVTVLFELTERGRPISIEVESATTDAHAEVVERALRRWRFEGDAEMADRTVRYRMPFVFRPSQS